MRKLVAVLTAVVLSVILFSAALSEAAEANVGYTVPTVDITNTFEIPDNEALRFIRDLKIGWNLGNTFDAYNGFERTSTDASMETSWVGVKTSHQLIAEIKAAGFNLIRIPVSWHNHVDQDYRIYEKWIARVEEVVRDALNEGLYVIVNVHHDNDVRYFYPDREHMEQSTAYLSSVWTQIAERFADCDDHLILESMNEPRLVGTGVEWTFSQSNAQCLEAAECINELNQLFVSTVRGTGGNNATRYLLIPAYAGSPYAATESAFVLPEDTADNRIIVETHGYIPYDFALNLNSNDTSFDLDNAGTKKNAINDALTRLYNKFVANGIPVLMDEFGALNKKNNTQDRINFAAYYTAAASARGITCVWWDNHAFAGGGELFGLINRRTCEWVFPEIVEALMKNCLCHRET